MTALLHSELTSAFASFCPSAFHPPQSRILHETGLKHKGNYERFIRDIYKRGERDQKDKAEEAREIARIEAVSFKGFWHSRKADHLHWQAANAAMGLSATSSAPVASTSRKPPPAPTDKFANYSTAESLGYTEDPEVKKLIEAEEERKKEGRIGEWERVAVRKVVKPVVEGEEKPLEDVKPLDEAAQAAEERREEEDRPSTKRWLKEKTAPSADDEWDPSKVAPIKLKRKILTLKEEEEQREAEEQARKVKKEAEREERRKAKAAMTKEGWQEVEVTEEPLLEFDEPVEPPPATEEEKPEEKVKVESPAEAPSGFKKRKMFGAGAARKK